MPIAYWFGYIGQLAIVVYALYRVIRATVAAYRKAHYWKMVGYAAITGTFIILIPAKVWWGALFYDISLSSLIPAALIGACLGLVIIWLERRYYPDQ